MRMETQATMANLLVLSVVRHKKRHDKPFKCTVNGCTSAFQYRKDLTRHYGTKHPDMVEEPTTYFCHVEGCKYGFELGRGFPRKDNRDRHLASHAKKGDL
ncbi:hypothetical protein BDW59DRAFT_158274 [Aspergillus cavernicola]|uniref:C2H2-type domain-containing protein n=1 Tax=Aspergillus cavernicola TaxID=176166 RepID=A0ABR4IU64_9EURO